MSDKANGNEGSDLSGKDKKKGISRRQFVGAAAGAGVVAAAAAAAAAAGIFSSAGSGNDNSNASSSTDGEYSETNPIDKDGSGQGGSIYDSAVMPLSECAQYLLAILCPECLASLVGSFEDAERPTGIEDADIVVTGIVDEEGRDSFASLAQSCSPRLLVDVGYYSDGREEFVEGLSSALGAECVFVDLNGVSFAGAMSRVAEGIGCAASEAALGQLEAVDQMLDEARSVDEGSRFEVYLGSGADGFTPIAQNETESRVLANASAIAFETGSREHASLDDFSSGTDCDIVFLTSSTASAGYLQEDADLFDWRLSLAGNTGCIIPGLVGGVRWFDDLSDFSKLTVGAAWMASVLYSGKPADEINGAAADFFETLFEGTCEQPEFAQEASQAIDARFPTTKEQVVAEKESYERERAQSAQESADRMDQGNDSSSYTDEQLREVYEALCESTGNEATEEGWSQFLEEVRNSQ